MASINNLYVDAGADYSVTITVENMDLTDYTVRSQMRKSYGSSTAYDFTGAVTDGPNGKFTLVLLAADSEDIPGGRWLYDVEVTSPGGTRTRVVEGIVVINPQITQT